MIVSVSFLVQLAILAGCLALLWQIARSWPYPAPLVRGLLPPQAAYPVGQIREWVESGDFDPGFLRFFNRDPERTPPPGTTLLAPGSQVVAGETEIAHRAGQC